MSDSKRYYTALIYLTPIVVLLLNYIPVQTLNLKKKNYPFPKLTPQNRELLFFFGGRGGWLAYVSVEMCPYLASGWQLYEYGALAQ
jgi:uncharacterized SAM-binding protein YcdF (DUF218 family)